MTADRRNLVALIEGGSIPKEQVSKAILASGLHPDSRAWRNFLDRLLLWLGSLALSFAILFFIAYNWAEMGRLFRFGLVEVALVIALAAHWKFHSHRLLSQAALMAASLLLGVLLALFGQTYQTGADPWQLFFNWAVLMLPWVFLGRFAALWILWLLLINVSVMLYYQAFGGIFNIVFGSDFPAHWLLFVINTAALAAWELAARRWSWLEVTWAKRLIALGSGLPITLLAFLAIDDHGRLWVPVLFMYPLWLATLYGIYRWLLPDLFMLAGACLSGIAVIVFFLGHNLLRHTDAGSFLLLAIVILGLSAAAAVWLKRVHREMST